MSHPVYTNGSWKKSMRGYACIVRRNIKDRNDAEKWVHVDPDQMDEIIDELELLGTQRDALREALQHIADEATWHLTDGHGTRVGGGFMGESIRHKAREALAKVDEA